jgi:1,4-dihydroxy-2-naphthoyl-CoA hydrolase
MLTLSVDEFNLRGVGFLPGHLGIVFTDVAPGRICAQLEIKPYLMAPNGYLHAGTIVTLADTCAGYGCISSLPAGATGFTTVELKSNHLGTAREGVVECVATAVHRGSTTQVWDAVIKRQGTDKPIALFRCTQLILYAKPTAREQ